MISAKQLGRQLGNSALRLGRQLSGTTQKLGRQLQTSAKLLPQAFKDTSRVYSQLESKTKNIPIVNPMLGLASAATGGIGQILGGHPERALGSARQASDNWTTTLQQAERLAPLATLFL